MSLSSMMAIPRFCLMPEVALCGEREFLHRGDPAGSHIGAFVVVNP